MRPACSTLSKANRSAFCYPIDQGFDHHEMMRIDTNEDYSVDACEAPMPQTLYMEKKLEKAMLEIIKVQDKNHKALGAKINNIKIEFDAKFKAIHERVLMIEEKVHNIDFDFQNKKEYIQDHNTKIINLGFSIDPIEGRLKWKNEAL